MYGPLWIMVTLVVELLVLGHLASVLRIELGFGQNSAQRDADQALAELIVSRYGGKGGNSMIFDPSSAISNAALSRILRVTFIVAFFFFVVPLGTHLTFLSATQN